VKSDLFGSPTKHAVVAPKDQLDALAGFSLDGGSSADAPAGPASSAAAALPGPSPLGRQLSASRRMSESDLRAAAAAAAHSEDSSAAQWTGGSQAAADDASSAALHLPPFEAQWLATLVQSDAPLGGQLSAAISSLKTALLLRVQLLQEVSPLSACCRYPTPFVAVLLACFNSAS
jgi:hypothetical protein